MVGPAIAVAGGIARNIAMRTLAAEGAILGKAWIGFKARREIVAGIRTGLGLGAGIGSFINDGSNPFNEDGQIPFKSQANKFRQKYSRRSFSRSGSSRYHNCRPCKNSKRLRRSGRRSSYRR